MAGLPRHIQPSFAAGELSPSLWGRTDLSRYHIGTAKLENFFVHPEGGASNRPGMQFVGELKGPTSLSGAKIKLVPFHHAPVPPASGSTFPRNTYLFVFFAPASGNYLQMAVLKDGAFVVDDDPSGATGAKVINSSTWVETDVSNEWAATSYTPTSQEAELAPLSMWFGKDVLPSMTYTEMTQGRVGALAPYQWGYGTSGASPTVPTVVVRSTANPSTLTDQFIVIPPYRLTTPYLKTIDLSLLKYTQSADAMYFVHPDYPPYMLQGRDPFYWWFTAMSFAPTVATPPAPVTAFWGNSIGRVQEQVQYRVSQNDLTTGEESVPTAAVTQTVNLPWQARDRVSIVWNSVVVSGTYTWSQYLTTAAYKLDQTLNPRPDEVYSGFGIAREKMTLAASLAAMSTTPGTWWWVGGALYVHFSSMAYYEYVTTPNPQLKPNGFVRFYRTGTEFNVYKSSRGYFGWVGTVQACEFIDDNVDPDVSDGPQVQNTPFGSVANYPGAVTIFEQRLVFARTKRQPQTVWGSTTGNYANMNTSTPLKDTDALEVTIAAPQLNEIRHLVPLDSLLIFTSGAEWLMTHGDNSDAITPTSVQFRLQGYRGCNEVPPLIIGNSVLFAQRNSQSIREIAYSFEQDGYATSDISVMSQHLFDGRRVVDWVYQQEPYQLVWVVMNDGNLLTLTYVKEQQVWAWARHNPSYGYDYSKRTGILATAAIQGLDYDDVYFAQAVNTTGGGVRYVISRIVDRDASDHRSGCYLDNAIGYGSSSSPVYTRIRSYLFDSTFFKVFLGPGVAALGDALTVYGVSDDTYGVSYQVIGVTDTAWIELGDIDTGDPIDSSGYVAYEYGSLGTVVVHTSKVFAPYHALANLGTVSTLVDGVPGTATLLNGALTLGTPAEYQVWAGLPYVADLETLDIDVPQNTVKGRTKNTPRAALQLQNTRGGQIGNSEETLSEIPFSEDEYDSDTGLFTGTKDTVVAGRWNNRGRIYIRQADPLPITVAAIVQEVTLDDT